MQFNLPRLYFTDKIYREMLRKATHQFLLHIPEVLWRVDVVLVTSSFEVLSTNLSYLIARRFLRVKINF